MGIKSIWNRIWKKSTPKYPTPNKPLETISWNNQFADISHHEDNFNPAMYQVKAPILLHKCTEGISFIDNLFEKRKQLCKLQGILYGGYHFYLCKNNPITQADFYLKQHGTFDFIPIIDFETSNNQDENDLIKSIEKFYSMLKYIQTITGKTPMIYLNRGFALSNPFPEKFAEFPVWFARYSSALGTIPKPFTQVIFWQYSDKEYFSGIGSCDVNLYYKESKFLDQYLKGGI